MARRTKEQLRIARNEERLDALVKSNKYLREPIYYKNNYWSWAAWDSWAAKGQAGSCGCGCGYYNANLCNKRVTTEKGGRRNNCKHAIEKLCSDCVMGIEKRVNIQFKKRY